ncbi:glycoside hydrolase family 13 protein [Jaapia argillacea MUCL 33604]|uniref:Alpha-amylase n=1 Tax=Jaapia argillacea MUCL 33604 TaxID=933084 RepID=A0A067PTN6_9AGAM|nr:glycoside hydrolase family 13 protein [Jaapia argillacea MUCL 33604]
MANVFPLSSSLCFLLALLRCQSPRLQNPYKTALGCSTLSSSPHLLHPRGSPTLDSPAPFPDKGVLSLPITPTSEKDQEQLIPQPIPAPTSWSTKCINRLQSILLVIKNSPRTCWNFMKGHLWLTMMAFMFLIMIAVAVASQTAPFEGEGIGDKDVIVQMFQWSWDSIASECTNFLGPAGYGYVQASPAQEHVQGPQWWTDYQPVSYQISSKRGSRSQYQAMVQTCHAAGVLVIADTILNHMSGQDNGGTGVAGTQFQHYEYPGLYSNSDFHHCGLEPGDEIVDYTKRAEVQTCELVNLADLATETEHVRAALAAYGNDLLSLGVDGLRLDAAKHVAAADLINITSRFIRKPYMTQEVIWGQSDAVQPGEYVGIGNVQEFRYTTALKEAFSMTGIANLKGLEGRGWIASNDANVFVANHDTERNGGGLNYKAASNMYILATIFSLAYPYGRPSVLSGYDFQNIDVGSPNNGAGTCSNNGGAAGWLCQHRWTAFAGMVGWRNKAGKAPVTNWFASGSQQIAFGRGSVAFIVINNADAHWSGKFNTSLPAGTYCDVIHGTITPGRCDQPVYTIAKDGSFEADIKPRDALALHTGIIGSSRLACLPKTVATRDLGIDTIVTLNQGDLASGGQGLTQMTIPGTSTETRERDLGIDTAVTPSQGDLTDTPARLMHMSTADLLARDVGANTAVNPKQDDVNAGGMQVHDSSPYTTAGAHDSGLRTIRRRSGWKIMH